MSMIFFLPSPHYRDIREFLWIFPAASDSERARERRIEYFPFSYASLFTLLCSIKQNMMMNKKNNNRKLSLNRLCYRVDAYIYYINICIHIYPVDTCSSFQFQSKSHWEQNIIENSTSSMQICIWKYYQNLINIPRFFCPASYLCSNGTNRAQMNGTKQNNRYHSQWDFLRIETFSI